MKEKELRLALVCYGGISLAVYMHGISKEFLKAVRASKIYHSRPDYAERQRASFADLAGPAIRTADTERVYFDLIKAIGKKLDLRLLIDVIAGASAGGINGIILGRALAHDLQMDALRDVWFKHADVSELLSEESRAGKFSKFYLRPLFYWMGGGFGHSSKIEKEAAAKLSMFVRSRWFKAPFDGEKLLGILFDAIEEMGEPAAPDSSLVPSGLPLELFVTVTDFYGYTHHIPIHDPPIVAEREHRHVLRFLYRRWRSGEMRSDFNREHVPSLAFAARATSSYPGAFPPAQISEVDRMLEKRSRSWRHKTQFLESNFRPYRLAGLNPMMTSFVDGSVLNNKPFEPAIEAIRTRAAYRDVDRRLIYIDPHPEQIGPPPDGEVPGFFSTLKGAISEIPRSEPVHDDLSDISAVNAQVQRRKTVVDAARPHVAELVSSITRDRLHRRISMETLRSWRDAANSRAAVEAGFVYEGYVRLKLASVEDNACRLISGLCRYSEGSAQFVMIRAVIDIWARMRGIYPEEGNVRLVKPGTAHEGLPAWVRFLEAFDIDFRRRRLRFMIQNLNHLYSRLHESHYQGLRADDLDALKGEFYDALESLRQFDHVGIVARETAIKARELFRKDMPDLSSGAIPDHAYSFAAANMERVDALQTMLANDIDLDAVNHKVDQILCRLSEGDWPVEAKREVLTSYLGYSYWDVLTFSVTNWRDLGEYDEIRVDRFSPDDCTTIRKGSAETILKGITFKHFGAFLSRKDRENDYLWGRLHAAERLIDILYDAAKVEEAEGGIDKLAFKKRAFETILDVEADHLPHCAELIRTVRAEVAAL